MPNILEPVDLQGLRGRIAIDVETQGGHAPHLGSLVGLGVWAEDAGVIGYVPGDRAQELHDVIVNTWETGSWLIAHNLKYEARWLLLTEQELRRFQLFDTAVAEHLLNEEYMKDLGSTETRRLGTKSKRSLLEMAKDQGFRITKVDEWPTKLLAEYCVNDCAVTYRIAREQVPLLRQERLEQLFSRLMRYLRVIHGAEQRGMFIDEEAHAALQKKVAELIEHTDQTWAYTLEEHGILREVNYNSPKQLSEVLYGDLGIPKPEAPAALANSPKAAKYNGTATGKDILKKLDHPIAKTILQIRLLHKQDGYLRSYTELAEKVDGGYILHPDFNVTGTKTGRLSSSNPNMQQVPAKPVLQDLDPTGEGIFLRPIFKARPGYTLASIDYQQMEAVVFGLLAKDPEMMKLISAGGDLHEATARLLFGGYDDRKRKVVKTLNFGILYGLGRAGLAESLGVTPEESDEMMDHYLEAFPRVRPYMSEVAQELRAKGFIRYWSGRKRRIADREKHYKGVNSIVQGGCADALAEATIRVQNQLDDTGGYLIALIHDELLLEVPKDSAESVVKTVRRAMSVPDVFGISLNTDAALGDFWPV